ncbi:glutaredoxin 3 [Brevipalpus obovatus]|uniref:glutaredoxin 3 n=1 Tax=Brevipalpus obovatus TaxID=246614 RepID=UPI003D9DCE09
MNSHMVNIDVDPSLENHLKKSNDSVLVLHFWANFQAQKSRQINDVVDEAIKTKVAPIECVLIDVEKYKEIAEKYKIETIPTCVIICKEQEYGRVDGCDNSQLMKLMKEAGFKNFPLQVRKFPEEGDNDLNSRLKSLLNKSKIMVFMKGTKENPRCKFTRALLEILNGIQAEFEAFDILEDEEVRQGLKALSNWPTYPQVYVNGSLIGGLDIIRELNEVGELKSAFLME